MIIEHIHKTQNDGRVIQVTAVSHSSPSGTPMASSFHGWLNIDQVKDTLKYYRSVDRQQEKFNG